MTNGKRLHISPLNAELLPIILPGPLLEKASNISFHSIQTFPEKGYGYAELPEVDADKLKRKLNGSTVKGAKMRVEEARPKRVPEEKTAQEDEIPELKERKEKRKKVKGEGVIPGHELHDRKVKRGWTEPSSESKHSKLSKIKGQKDKADKKSKSKASFLTGEAECLFKAKLPPNVATTGSTKDGKIKKRKRGEAEREAVVHEFANTTKHASFLRDESDAGGKKPATEYVEGQGWVDEDGNIVEEGPKRRRSKVKAGYKGRQETEQPEKPRSRRSSRLEVPAIQLATSQTRRVQPTVAEADETSSSGTSSSEDESEEVDPIPAPPAQRKSPIPRQRKVTKATSKKGLQHSENEGDRFNRLSITRSCATPPASEGSPPTSAPITNEVHPLNILFKKPDTAASHTAKKPDLEVTTTFSFFEPDAEEGDSQTLLVPQTPFTQQDIRQRRQRSAAPTPDTAAPGKTFGAVWEGTDDGSGSDEDIEDHTKSKSKDTPATPDVKVEKPESEFRKWFYDNRGDNNRSQKRGARQAGKKKRQEDNKARR